VATGTLGYAYLFYTFVQGMVHQAEARLDKRLDKLEALLLDSTVRTRLACSPLAMRGEGQPACFPSKGV
jgi:hypothetical protein